MFGVSIKAARTREAALHEQGIVRLQCTTAVTVILIRIYWFYLGVPVHSRRNSEHKPLFSCSGYEKMTTEGYHGTWL